MSNPNPRPFTDADRAKGQPKGLAKIRMRRQQTTIERSVNHESNERVSESIRQILASECPEEPGRSWSEAIIERMVKKCYRESDARVFQMLLERIEGKPVQQTVERQERMVLSESTVTHAGVQPSASLSSETPASHNATASLPAHSLPIDALPVPPPIPPNRGGPCSEDPHPESHAAPHVLEVTENKGDNGGS